MPFTFSHPAAAVPFARCGLVLSALVVGSMAPDFGYFFPLLPDAHFSHTLSGVLLFCVPAGLAVLWLFHTFLKRPALALLPAGHQNRLMAVTGGFSFGPPRRFVLILVSLATGALTHVGWDSFTHSYGWMVSRVPVLSLTLVETALGSLRVYKLLQHGSTLIGAGLLCFWYLSWYRRTPAQPAVPVFHLTSTTKLISLVSMSMVAVVVATGYGLAGVTSVSDFEYLRQFVGRAVVAGIQVLMVEFIFFSVFWHLKALSEQRHPV